MKEFIIELFGQGKELAAYQMAARTVVVFLIAILLLRIAGRRAFGMKMPLDNVVTILLGAILSRSVVGASAFVPTVTAASTLVVFYRLLAWLCLRFPVMEDLLKGKRIPLYRDGQFVEKTMRRGMISKADFEEELHTSANVESVREIETAWLERSGEIGFAKKPE